MKELDRKAAAFDALAVRQQWSPQKPNGPYGDGSKGKGKGKGGRKCFTWIRQGPGRGLNCGNPSCSFDHSLPSTRSEAQDIKNFARSLNDWSLDLDYDSEHPRVVSAPSGSSNTTVASNASTVSPASAAVVAESSG
ncbi:unnamed protein product [Amoebophrya sp. A25]|nr:unnamed protein product [Amoebophrya sp. A25]|eukprot:GSA25T00024981001.1